MKIKNLIPIFTIIFLFSCMDDENFNDTVIVTVYPESCYNGVLDKDEMETDCGGICLECTDYLYDPRDEQSYPTVKINNQRWMTSNLNYAGISSSCYDGLTINCNEFGRLYFDDQIPNLCPTGWKIPTRDDWDILLSNYTSSEEAYISLRTGGDSGLNAQLGGRMEGSGTILSYGWKDFYGYYYSSSVNFVSQTYVMHFIHEDQNQGTASAELRAGYNSYFGYSCRCMRDTQ